MLDIEDVGKRSLASSRGAAPDWQRDELQHLSERLRGIVPASRIPAGLQEV